MLVLGIIEGHLVRAQLSFWDSAGRTRICDVSKANGDDDWFASFTPEGRSNGFRLGDMWYHGF
jgi:hypothetical protein